MKHNIFITTAVVSLLFAVAHSFGQQAVFYTVCACSLFALIGSALSVIVSVFRLFCNSNKKEESNNVATKSASYHVDGELAYIKSKLEIMHCDIKDLNDCIGEYFVPNKTNIEKLVKQVDDIHTETEFNKRFKN